MKVRVGVFFGGRSVEHEVSIISALQAINAIDKDLYSVIPVYISKQGVWYTGDALFDVDNYRDMESLFAKCKKILVSHNAGENTIFNYPQGLFRKNILDQIDVAFPVMHGAHGEDGCLQGMFEIMNIPYAGPGVLASAVGMDKIAMKALFKDAGLPMVKDHWFYAKHWLQDQDKEMIIAEVEKKVGYPVIVKPANLGSSVGITKAANREEFEDAVELARSFSERILVEEMIVKLREINCAVLGDYEHAEASVCEEPITAGDILSYQDKYLSGGGGKGMSGTRRRIPAELPDSMTKEIQELAKKAFLALDLSGVCRIDFLIDEASSRIYVNECNTIPGSLAFYLWEPAGKSFTQLTTDLIKLALKKHREKENLVFSYESNILQGKGLKGIKK